MDELPEDIAVPFTINGIKFNNREDYVRRLDDDATQLAHLLYDIYQDKKLSDNTEP